MILSKPLILLALLPLALKGQQLNTNFRMPLPVKQADVNEMQWMENGKILLGGRINFYEDVRVNNLVRLNEDGSLDNSFNSSADIGVVRKFKLLSSGEIVVGTRSYLHKLGVNGNTIQSVSLESGETLEVLIIKNDDIFIVTSINYGAYSEIRKYDSDLIVDDTFSPIQLDGRIDDLKIHQDRLLIVGRSLSLSQVDLDRIVRLNMDGTLDGSFGLEIEVPYEFGTIDNITFWELFIADDKIFVHSNAYNGILKLNADGSQDIDFYLDNAIFNHVHLDEVYIEDNNIYVTGYSNYYGDNTSYETRLLKYDIGGQLDTAFEPSILSEKNEEISPILATDGSGALLLANINNQLNRYGLNKFLADGSIDETFRPKVGTYGKINIAEIHGDKFVIAGDFNRLDQYVTSDIAVLNLDGSVDETFSFSENIERTPTDIAFHEGNVFLANESEVHKILSDGRRDASFNTKPQFEYNGFAVEWFGSYLHIQEDKKIVTTSPNGVFRMLANGDPDETYGPLYPNISSTPFSSSMQNDGKVVYASHFNIFNGENFMDMVRINSDGSLDDSFQVSRDPSQLYAAGITDIVSLTNNEIMVFGYFDRFSGYAAPKHMVKLDQNGKVDERFLDFLNQTFTADVYGFNNYTSFRGGFTVSGWDEYLILNDELAYNYELYVFNKSGIYQSKFQLPEGYSARQEIIPLVITNNDIILLSEFFSDEEEDPIYAIRLKVNNLPKIVNHTKDAATKEGSITLNSEDLDVEDDDNTYPDDFYIKIYSGPNYSVNDNRIVPHVGFSGILEVPVTVDDGSNESNYVLIPIQVESETITGSEDWLSKIYPNPATNFIEISCDDISNVKMMNLDGKEIQVQVDNKRIDLSRISPGMYLLEIKDSQGNITVQKVIRE